MSVVVASCTVAELFSNEPIQARDGSLIEGTLCLPEYQRSYCWRDSELQGLLADLHEYFVPSDGRSQPSHMFYLGSIMLHQAHDRGVLNIIDGQQRLATLGLLVKRNGCSGPAITFSSPISQAQIDKNTAWLQERYPEGVGWFDLDRINVTLVITRNEDDAYRFFETQNTGGVRLSGPDIIKAHHLRAAPRERRDHFGQMWEAMGDLQQLADVVLRIRRWNRLEWRPVPSYRQIKDVRKAIVEELADETSKQKQEDHAYQRVTVTRRGGGAIQEIAAMGYAMRQPLNAGVNTIHYLQYFQSVKEKLFEEKHHDLKQFQEFYRDLVCKLEGCSFIKKLYDSCLILYASHLGTDGSFYKAGLWLFRAVYSLRVSQEVVREKSVASFVRDSEYPIVEWILMSYSQEQCLSRLSSFPYSVSPNRLGINDSGVKKEFVEKVINYLKMQVPPDSIAQCYDQALKAAIEAR